MTTTTTMFTLQRVHYTPMADTAKRSSNKLTVFQYYRTARKDCTDETATANTNIKRIAMLQYCRENARHHEQTGTYNQKYNITRRLQQLRTTNLFVLADSVLSCDSICIATVDKLAVQEPVKCQFGREPGTLFHPSAAVEAEGNPSRDRGVKL